MATRYTNPGGRIGPKTKTSKRTVTNPDGTRTIITTIEVTTTTAFKEETTTKVDRKHLPSLPRIRRERVEMDDGTSGWKKTSTVVHPSGQREITIEWPNGEKELKIEEGPKYNPEEVESIPKEHKKELPSWPSYPWDSTLKRLGRHAEVSPHKTAIAFLSASGTNVPTTSSSLTYQKLNYAVEYLASRLLPPEGSEPDPKKALVPTSKDQAQLARGDRVLLVYPPCAPHFVIAFLACLRAGLVAVPVYPPHPGRKDSVSAFVGIARGCGAKIALTNGEYAQAKRLGKMKDAFTSKWKKKKAEGAANAPGWPEELLWVVTDKEPLLNPPAKYPKTESTPEPHDTAFIQYTSGSTSAPKGVALTHSNLAHNLYIITDELDASEETTVVSWLPQYHDMGLIGSLVGTVYCGGSGYYMSPIAFLQRPMGWMEAVSEFRGTHLQSPNFAFGLTARKFDPREYYHGTGGITVNEDGKQVKPLDLSCLKHIINGAEPVTEKSMGAFTKVFAPFGLPDGIIYPTYGLAEHTVFVCSGGKGKITVDKRALEQENKVIIVGDGDEPEGGTINFLGCGFPGSQNVDVRVVDPVRRVTLPDGTVGEIWVNSPSKALGYYGVDVKETKFEFHAVLEDMKAMSVKFGGFLRTGDLGFLHEEQVYICGRIKDLIIVGGRNHYPQDIEATAEDIASAYVRPGCSAAFSIGSKSSEEKGEYEEVVLAMELKEPLPKAAKYESVATTVRNEVFKEHSVSLSSVVLVKQKSMPKTTSGKIQRSRAQQAFLGKMMQEIYRKDFVTGDVAEFGYVNLEEEEEKAKVDPSPAVNLTPDEIRALQRSAIREMLCDAISKIANVNPSSIKHNIPVREVIMDSVNLAQLKGLMEGKYGVKPMSDGYLFQDDATVVKLVEVIKCGVAKDDTGEGSSAPKTKGPLPCCAVM